MEELATMDLSKDRTLKKTLQKVETLSSSPDQNTKDVP
jgi:hypothetical protein